MAKKSKANIARENWVNATKHVLRTSGNLDEVLNCIYHEKEEAASTMAYYQEYEEFKDYLDKNPEIKKAKDVYKRFSAIVASLKAENEQLKYELQHERSKLRDILYTVNNKYSDDGEYDDD